MNIESILVDFIPIILIYSFAVDTRRAIMFSSTILGKLLAVSIVIFYTAINPAFGALICMITLVYYQSDFVEEILNIERGERTEQELAALASTYSSFSPGPQWASADASTKFAEGFQSNAADLYAYTPGQSYRKDAEHLLGKTEKNAELKAIFRKENCRAGVLHHRGSEINPEMTQHIFREIRMEGEKCNPCDPDCAFSIIESRINAESEIQRPVSSNDFLEKNVESIRQMLWKTHESVLGFIQGEKFSSLV
jgi:hypothetical protein